MSLCLRVELVLGSIHLQFAHFIVYYIEVFACVVSNVDCPVFYVDLHYSLDLIVVCSMLWNH